MTSLTQLLTKEIGKYDSQTSRLMIAATFETCPQRAAELSAQAELTGRLVNGLTVIHVKKTGQLPEVRK